MPIIQLASPLHHWLLTQDHIKSLPVIEIISDPFTDSHLILHTTYMCSTSHTPLLKREPSHPTVYCICLHNLLVSCHHLFVLMTNVTVGCGNKPSQLQKEVDLHLPCATVFLPFKLMHNECMTGPCYVRCVERRWLRLCLITGESPPLVQSSPSTCYLFFPQCCSSGYILSAVYNWYVLSQWTSSVKCTNNFLVSR